MTWPVDELRRIVEADDLHNAPFREDGETYGTPTWIWSVAVGGDLYVRAYHGQNSRWYRSARQQKAGRIMAAGMTRDVVFEPGDDADSAAIDEAYRVKYRGNRYLDPMVGPRARSTTIRVIPRPASDLLPP